MHHDHQHMLFFLAPIRRTSEVFVLAEVLTRLIHLKLEVSAQKGVQ